MEKSILLSIIIFMLMFIISGVNKVSTLGRSEMTRFASKVPQLADYSQMIVLVAGIIELIASFAIIYGSYTGNKQMAIYGIYGLILFTVLATLIFYASPFKYKPALSNLSIIAGLYLMLNICFFKNGTLS